MRYSLRYSKTSLVLYTAFSLQCHVVLRMVFALIAASIMTSVLMITLADYTTVAYARLIQGMYENKYGKIQAGNS